MKAIYKRILGFSLILFLPLYWIASEAFYARGNRPSGVSNVVDFCRAFGPPKLIRQYERDGETFYHLYGRAPHLPWILAFPSSPPVYIFDSMGRFIEWFSDPGDDSRYQQQWPLRESKPVDADLIQEQCSH